jgi:hypothetical protein
MDACPQLPLSLTADDTIPTWQESLVGPESRGSGIRLASEKPTLPPPPPTGDVMVSRIHLGPSVDEVLYRLSLGDLSGAALANEELERCVPERTAAAIVVHAMQLTYLEEYMLTLVDGHTLWGDVLDSSPFAPKDTLQALCDLVDKGAVTLNPPVGSTVR